MYFITIIYYNFFFLIKEKVVVNKKSSKNVWFNFCQQINISYNTKNTRYSINSTTERC